VENEVAWRWGGVACTAQVSNWRGEIEVVLICPVTSANVIKVYGRLAWSK